MLWSETVCGRPIHPALAHDKIPVCLMHSRDPHKSDSEFQKEFDAILKAPAGRDAVAEFTEFVFPSANYQDRKFWPRCSFWGAIFTQGSNFHGARFTQEASFSHAEFTQKAYFSEATFTKEADFAYAKFMQDTYFFNAKFAQDVDFRSAEFAQAASFEHAKFSASAVFRETQFRGYSRLKHETNDKVPGPVFSLAEFSHPEDIVFYKTYLGQALFHNCDVSKVTFSSAEWRTRKRSGRRMLLEEEVDLENSYASALKTKEEVDPKNNSASTLKTGPDSHDERDYGLIAELYQQLKKNYDERKDYWTAGDFHYGEMEIKRLDSRSPKPWVRWLHQHLGLVACYKYASSYGESYLRPLLALVIVLGIFMLLYPLAGLRSGGTAPPASATVTQQASPPMLATELSYCHFAEFVRAYPGAKWIAGPAFFGHSLMTTLAVASLQKELRYEPFYPWGRALALVQLVLTSTLIALFLLALRRQFRR
jgi:uncharacterized protein YjbI with pentapeptide repeats